MGLRSRDKQLSFEILSTDAALFLDRSNSDPFPLRDHELRNNGRHGGSGDDDDYHDDDDDKRNRRKRKHHKKKSKRKKNNSTSSPSMNPIVENGVCSQFREMESNSAASNGYAPSAQQSYASTYTSVVTTTVCEESESGSAVRQVSMGELRQRSVAGSGGGGMSVATDDSGRVAAEKEDMSCLKANGSAEMNGRRLETSESLDWRQLMTDDPADPFPVENSPIKYFMEEIYSGNSLRSTTASGNEKERERVYDTIFRLPWRCELLINVGFFVCFNSFLSLLTIIPSRAVLTVWRFLTRRQFKKISAAELSDFGCFVVLAGATALLGRTDISLIYHMIRGQGIIKLYVVYNVLEIFDKLWQSFGGDVFQTFFSSAEGLACCSPESSTYWIERYTIDLLLAAASSIVHSFILLAQAITLSTCIVAHNNALFALLVSNNFAEIKSNVFKRFSKDNVHSIVYSDSIERFHITAFVIFVLAQNIQEAEGSWFGNFLSNALLVYFSEMAIDIIKHSFIAKFNDIKPVTYSEFLEDLCKQTLNIRTDGPTRTLTFVPLAPACVVIRVMTPVFTARLPCSPLPWRLFWIVCLTGLTYVMLVSLKVMIGMGLQKHAAWYVKRCQKRKLHSD